MPVNTPNIKSSVSLGARHGFPSSVEASPQKLGRYAFRRCPCSTSTSLASCFLSFPYSKTYRAPPSTHPSLHHPPSQKLSPPRKRYASRRRPRLLLLYIPLQRVVPLPHADLDHAVAHVGHDERAQHHPVEVPEPGEHQGEQHPRPELPTTVGGHGEREAGEREREKKARTRENQRRGGSRISEQVREEQPATTPRGRCTRTQPPARRVGCRQRRCALPHKGDRCPAVRCISVTGPGLPLQASRDDRPRSKLSAATKLCPSQRTRKHNFGAGLFEEGVAHAPRYGGSSRDRNPTRPTDAFSKHTS